MGTSFIPLCAIIAVLIIAFLYASLPQINHKTRYRVLYAIAIIMLFAVIPISEYMSENTKNPNSNYLLVLIFDIAVGYFCMYIAALLKFNVLKRKNQALENALTEKQQENVAILLEHQNEKYIHKHSFEIKSSKIFSFVVGLGMVCALSLWGNVAQWQSNRQYADDALKFRAIRSWGGCNANDVLWLNKVFDLLRDKKAIEWIRKQANGYETSLKTVSDSLMQESLKKKQNSKV